MKASSTTGTAYISIGAGIIPALFVSSIATACLTAALWLMGGAGDSVLPLPNEWRYFIGIAVEYSPYGGLAYLIHVLSIYGLPNLGWTKRAALYAACGAALAVSFLRLQIGLSGITLENFGTADLHIMVILGALTALITYAFHGIVRYGVERAIEIMEQ